jgi:hypothetical protein
MRASAHEGKSLKQLLLDLSEAHLKEMEKKGFCQRGRDKSGELK